MTRQEYLDVEGDKTKAHQDYYGQFVGPTQISIVSRWIGVDRIKASTDPHFNDIPLKEWDSLSIGVLAVPMSSVDDYLTLAGKVCIAKEAARQIKEGAK